MPPRNKKPPKSKPAATAPLPADDGMTASLAGPAIPDGDIDDGPAMSGAITGPPVETPPEPEAAEPAGGGDEINLDAESALIDKYQQLVEVPQFLKPWYARFDNDRRYVNEVCMLMDDDDCVATNHAFRIQMQQIAQIYARDPDVSFTPREMMGPTDPMTGLKMFPPGLEDFAKTMAISTKRFMEEAGFKSTLTGMIQDTMTVGWSWLKVNTQEDYQLDPLGNRRQDDELDNFARLAFLKSQFDAGMFDDKSALYQQLCDCNKVVATYMQAQITQQLIEQPVMPGPPDPITGIPAPPQDHRLDMLNELQSGQLISGDMMPEVARFIGFNLDPVQAEDIRFDWSITRPEDLYSAAWFAHRVFMTKDQVGAKWQLTADELTRVTIYGPSGTELKSHWSSIDPTIRQGVDDPTINDRCAVWELWDKNQGMVYVWIQGMTRFMTKYVPKTTWRKWFPFVPLYFNRVTGRVIPLSDTTLIMPLQDEINELRTHDREARKSAYPRLIIAKGAMSQAEKENYENSYPYQVIELERPLDVRQAIQETVMAKYDGQLYDISRAVHDMEVMSGISQVAQGGVSGGAEDHFATDSAIANQQMGLASDSRKDAITGFIRDIAICIADIAVQMVPEANIKAMAGPMAVWPLQDKEQLFRQLQITVKAGSSGKPDSKQQMALWTQFASIAQSLMLPVNGVAVLEELIEAMGIQTDLHKFIGPPPLGFAGGPMGMGMPPGAAAGAPPPSPTNGMPGVPNGSPQPNPGAGAPPMAENGPPQGVPNYAHI